ncbi:hypothetical protein G9C85_00865 [Halorubellus sp. JP-L1]|uniref:hypothetical protein n=1 Tax=Halorubellus sp. JP-L1 TaxID=2715753 RepID=UPI00140D3492|nr:hypothetical protein [Halorubellus sp. JP-L1]NHN40186.1 hypothetical protein [Halorubellus sp. JP-L1]
MGSAAREATSWLLATLDFVFAFVGVGAVAYPTLRLVAELAGPTVPRGLVPLAAFALAFGASYPYVAGDWSLGRLGEFLFVAIASTLAWGVLVAGVVLALDLPSYPADPAPAATAWTLALATAYAVVYWRAIRLFR